MKIKQLLSGAVAFAMLVTTMPVQAFAVDDAGEATTWTKELSVDELYHAVQDQLDENNAIALENLTAIEAIASDVRDDVTGQLTAIAFDDQQVVLAELDDTTSYTLTFAEEDSVDAAPVEPDAQPEVESDAGESVTVPDESAANDPSTESQQTTGPPTQSDVSLTVTEEEVFTTEAEAEEQAQEQGVDPAEVSTEIGENGQVLGAMLTVNETEVSKVTLVYTANVQNTSDEIMPLSPMSNGETITLSVGESREVDGKKGTWPYYHYWDISGNKDIVEISGEGKSVQITAYQEGTVELNHTYREGRNNKTETWIVTVQKKEYGICTFDVYYLIGDELPDPLYGNGEAENYGPSRNDTPMCEVSIDIDALLENYYPNGANEGINYNGANTWYITYETCGTDMDTWWSNVLKCMDEDSQKALQATGLSEIFKGYVLKNQNPDGDYHLDGQLDVQPPVNVVELYLDGEYIGGTAVSEDVEQTTKVELREQYETKFKTEFGEGTANWVEGNIYFQTADKYYRLTESAEPEQSITDNKEVQFTNRSDEHHVARFYLTSSEMRVAYTPTTITIQKTDAETNADLSGARFGLYTDSSCTTKIDEATTNANGQATFTVTAPDTYYVKEISAPEGYVLSDETKTVTVTTTGEPTIVGDTVTFTLSASPASLTFTNEAKPTVQDVLNQFGKKAVADAGVTIPASTFSFTLKQDDNVIDTATAMVTNTDSVVSISAANGTTKLDDGIYTLSENALSAEQAKAGWSKGDTEYTIKIEGGEMTVLGNAADVTTGKYLFTNTYNQPTATLTVRAIDEDGNELSAEEWPESVELPVNAEYDVTPGQPGTTIDVPLAIIVNGVNYAYDAQEQKDALSGSLQADGSNEVDIVYSVDAKGGESDIDTPDEIPDKYQVFIKYVSADETMGTVGPKSFETYTAKQDGHYVVPTGPITINTGVSATPQQLGVKFKEWKLDDHVVSQKMSLGTQMLDSVVPGATYTFTAYFEHQTFTITGSIDHGTITNESGALQDNPWVQTVQYAGKAEFITFTPALGYQISSITKDGKTTTRDALGDDLFEFQFSIDPSDGSYIYGSQYGECTNVTKNHTVKVTTEPIEYELTVEHRYLGGPLDTNPTEPGDGRYWGENMKKSTLIQEASYEVMKKYGDQVSIPALSSAPLDAGYTFSEYGILVVNDSLDGNLTFNTETNTWEGTMPNGWVNLVFYYVPRTDLSYTVNYLDADTNEPIQDPKTVSNQTYGAEITSADEVVNVPGYTFNHADKDALTITAVAENNVINLYYKKASYTVAYQWENDLHPESAVLPSESTYKMGDPVGIDTTYTIGQVVKDNSGTYRFAGWSVADISVVDGQFVMPARDVTIIGAWVPMIEVTPADITIYTGGDGYTGAVNGSEALTDSGLPEPGFYVTLPEALDKALKAAVGHVGNGPLDLSGYVTITAKASDGNSRSWKLERYDNQPDHESMAYGKYIYRIVPTVEGQDPVRVQFKDDQGNVIRDDEFDIKLGTLYQKYDMSIYPGRVNENTVKITVNANQETGNVQAECAVDSRTGELTVRGIVDAITTDIVNAVPENAANITAIADAGTEYYINGSDLEVADGDIVKLLVDEIVDDAQSALKKAIIASSDNDIDEGFEFRFKYLDLVDTSNGNVWITPSKPMTVFWPYPKGTDEDTEFKVIHFDGLDRNYDNLETELEENSPEYLNVTHVAGGITFTVDSFSPFALVWEADDDNGGGGAHHPDAGDGDDDDNDDEEEIIDEEVPLAETPWLNTEDHYAYIIGYAEDGTVRPNANITRAEVATIFFRLLTDEARDLFWSTSNNFSDVTADAWYNNAVSTMVNAGIIQGYEDGTFRPNNNITRAEFAAIASRFMSSGYDVEEDLFTDIANHWARENINDAAMAGWINGYPGGIFLPDQAITRAEAVTLVNNVLQRKPDADHMLDSMIKWPDNPEGTWYYEAIQEATNSHDYDLFEDAEYETWTALQPNRDWAAIEKGWLDAHSA